ncbi:MAG: 30S ribosomal protein S6 [Candidatus Marinimicrobia bacterium]|nr:30S ribosomal protein S6 [Candidatus Neomarinimicrobiota bacterium]
MDKTNEQYEIGYLLKATLKEEEVSGFLEKLNEEIQKNKGLVTSEGKTKKQTLAYPIKKELSAIFGWIKFSLDSQKIENVKKLLDDNSNVLRFLIIKTKEEKQRKKPATKIFTPAKPPTSEEVAETKKEKVQEEEIDKKIEEIFGEDEEKQTEEETEEQTEDKN